MRITLEAPPFGQTINMLGILAIEVEVLEPSRMGTYKKYPLRITLEAPPFGQTMNMLGISAIEVEVLEPSRMGTYKKYPYLGFHRSSPLVMYVTRMIPVTQDRSHVFLRGVI